jgi:hypothetical protein
MTLDEAKRDAYVKIIIAGYSGKGLRLSADEVSLLAGDDAIEAVARDRLALAGYYFDGERCKRIDRRDGDEEGQS